MSTLSPHFADEETEARRDKHSTKNQDLVSGQNVSVLLVKRGRTSGLQGPGHQCLPTQGGE